MLILCHFTDTHSDILSHIVSFKIRLCIFLFQFSNNFINTLRICALEVIDCIFEPVQCLFNTIQIMDGKKVVNFWTPFNLHGSGFTRQIEFKWSLSNAIKSVELPVNRVNSSVILVKPARTWRGPGGVCGKAATPPSRSYQAEAVVVEPSPHINSLPWGGTNQSRCMEIPCSTFAKLRIGDCWLGLCHRALYLHNIPTINAMAWTNFCKLFT